MKKSGYNVLSTGVDGATSNAFRTSSSIFSTSCSQRNRDELFRGANHWEQMFAVVENVSEYREFVPWCRRSDVLSEQKHSMKAELEIGFPPLVESYTSRVIFASPVVVHSVCIDDRLFRKLETTFRFGNGLEKNGHTCKLHYDLAFEFRSSLHRRVAHLFFDQVVKTMVEAFLRRAEKKYGKPAIPHGEAKVLMYRS